MMMIISKEVSNREGHEFGRWLGKIKRTCILHDAKAIQSMGPCLSNAHVGICLGEGFPGYAVHTNARWDYHATV